jgi:hypothetical protein
MGIQSSPVQQGKQAMMKPAQDTPTALHGVAHANAFLQLIGLLQTKGTSVGMDPVLALNRAILDGYMSNVEEDANAETGFAYPDGIGDEDVRAYAERELGIPVNLSQVVAVRQFMGTLFLRGVTRTDVVRVRRMFFGKIIGE